MRKTLRCLLYRSVVQFTLKENQEPVRTWIARTYNLLFWDRVSCTPPKTCWPWLADPPGPTSSGLPFSGMLSPYPVFLRAGSGAYTLGKHSANWVTSLTHKCYYSSRASPEPYSPSTWCREKTMQGKSLSIITQRPSCLPQDHWPYLPCIVSRLWCGLGAPRDAEV